MSPVPELAAAPAFLDRLEAADRDALVALGRRRRHPARSIVFFTGDVAHEVVLVASGHLKVSMAVADRDMVLDVFSPGDIVGELSILAGGPRSATATTLTAAELCVIGADDLRAFLEARPHVTTLLWAGVVDRLRRASLRQVESGALDGVGRVCARLVEMMARFGHAGPDGAVTIDGPLTQTDIASWAGLSREAVVRAMQQLRAVGWVTTNARRLTVVDVDAVVARGSLPRPD